jgi:hypothetical protein
MIGFSSPLILLALLGLPLLWWLLKATPPKPRRQIFPPLVLLETLKTRSQSPAHTPWWLLVLRILLIGLVIMFCAGPMLNPSGNLFANNAQTIVVMVDNSWSSGASFEAIQQEALYTVDEAGRQDGKIILWPLADSNPDLSVLSALEAKDQLRALQPLPIPLQSKIILQKLTQLSEKMAQNAINFVYAGTGLISEDLSLAFQEINRNANWQSVFLVQTPDDFLTLKQIEQTGDLSFQMATSLLQNKAPVTIGLYDNKNNILEQQIITDYELNSAETISFDLPLPLLQDAAYARILQQNHAGAVALIDGRLKRKNIAILSGEKATQNQSLLRETHYLERAFRPYANITLYDNQPVQQALLQALDTNPSLIALVSVGQLSSEGHNALQDWIDQGGLLLRFASPELSLAKDPLTPVPLRAGSRQLGGTLSWQTPQGLGLLPQTSPFSNDNNFSDIVINKQILADPAALEPQMVWVELADGTPLVTAKQQGEGEIVLFHVPASPGWSNLPLSGLFETMMATLAARAPLFIAPNENAIDNNSSSQNNLTRNQTPLKPLRVLSGKGEWTWPDDNHRALDFSIESSPIVSEQHPPGFYGELKTPFALNLSDDQKTLAPITDFTPSSPFNILPFRSDKPLDLRPYLLALALLLLFIDSIAMVYLSGLFSYLQRKRSGQSSMAAMALFFGASLFMALLTMPSALLAQTAVSNDTFAQYASAETRLAYILTGNTEVDNISQKGLAGLSLVLAERTALEPGEPVGVDLLKDDLSLFPLLYWPLTADITARLKPQREAVLARLENYMQHGGTVLFDTRDATSPARLFSGALSPETAQLRLLLQGLDIPLLEPVPDDHVLGKTFYLLESFPGRTATGQLWVEQQTPAQTSDSRPVRQNDGVSSLLITSNNMAAAWALDENGLPFLPTIPPDPFQREWSYRAGINIVMYVLTGNYKADQVHVPALLERLGQ